MIFFYTQLCLWVSGRHDDPVFECITQRFVWVPLSKAVKSWNLVENLVICLLAENHKMTVRMKGRSFIYYVRKIFQKTNISYPLIRICTCAYQRVRNVSFSENFAYVLHEWSRSYWLILGEVCKTIYILNHLAEKTELVFAAYSNKYIIVLESC